MLKTQFKVDNSKNNKHNIHKLLTGYQQCKFMKIRE